MICFMNAGYNVLKMEDNGCSDTLDMPGKRFEGKGLFHDEVWNRSNHFIHNNEYTFHEHAFAL